MKNKTWMLYLTTIIIISIVVVVYAYRVISVEIYQNQIEAEREALLSEKTKLEEELKNVNNPDYIEQQARTQLKMIYPGEILYILPDKPEVESE